MQSHPAAERALGEPFPPPARPGRPLGPRVYRRAS